MFRIRTVSIIFLLFLLTGCDNEEKRATRARQTGYDANYKAGYQAGWEVGVARGRQDGERTGVTTAHEAATTGSALALYSTLACASLVCGILGGLFLQYSILLYCRLTKRVPHTMVGFVPAARNSPHYSFFVERYRRLLRAKEKEEEIETAARLKMEESAALHDVMVDRIKVASRIEHLAHERLTEMVEDEMSRIEARAERLTRGRPDSVCCCPHCGKRIVFYRKDATRTTKCPHRKCGEPIRLPG
jgi:hypothetical protein